VHFMDKFVKTTLQEYEVQRSKGNSKHLTKCFILDNESCRKVADLTTLTD